MSILECGTAHPGPCDHVCYSKMEEAKKIAEEKAKKK